MTVKIDRVLGCRVENSHWNTLKQRWLTEGFFGIFRENYPGLFLPGIFTRDFRAPIGFTRDYFTRDFRRATGWIKLSGIICTRDFRTPIGFTRDCHNPRKNYDGNVHHLLAVNSDHHRLELWGHGERAPCLWGQRVPDPRLNHLYHHPVPRLGDIIRKPFYFIFPWYFFRDRSNLWCSRRNILKMCLENLFLTKKIGACLKRSKNTVLTVLGFFIKFLKMM